LDDFASHVPSWRVRELRARLRAAQHEGGLGEPCGHEHRALRRRWAVGHRLHARTQQDRAGTGRAPGGWKAGAARGPGTGRRRIATGERLKVIEAAVAASFAGADWLTVELRPGDIKRAYDAIAQPLRAMGSARPSYQRFLKWLHWRRSLGPVQDLQVRLGPVLRHHPELRQMGLRHAGGGVYEGVVEGELVPALREMCARLKLPLG
jgi:hypothetical protein